MQDKKVEIVSDGKKVEERASNLMQTVKDKKELLEMATDLSVPGRHKMNMGQLANAIAKAELDELNRDDDGWGESDESESEVASDSPSNEAEEAEDDWPNEDGDDGADEAPTDKSASTEKAVGDSVEDWDKDHTSAEDKVRFINMAICGRTIVAYVDNRGRTKSAMIMKRKKADKRLLLQTSFGKEMVVSYDDIVWVRAGKKWPKGIYCALKGITEEEFDAMERASESNRCQDEEVKPGA